MDFISLCRRVRQEAGISGDGPAGVTNQTGELRRIVDWVREAYDEIQMAHNDWLWLRGQFTLLTEDGKRSYAHGDAIDVQTAQPIARFSRWLVDDAEDPSKIYLQAAGVGGQFWLTYFPWEHFNTIYSIGVQQTTTSMPAHIAVSPDRKLHLGPTPNDVYVVTGDYQRSPQYLSADGDIPEMPSEFHRLIVYGALERYGLFESAPEVLARVDRHRPRLMAQLQAQQRPAHRMAGPLA